MFGHVEVYLRCKPRQAAANEAPSELGVRGEMLAMSSCRRQYNPLSHIPQPQPHTVNTKYCKYCNADPREVVTTLLHSSYWRLGAGLMWSCRDTLCCTAGISCSDQHHYTVLYCTVLYQARFASQLRWPILVKSLLVRSVRCYIIHWQGTVLGWLVDPISSTLLWVFWNWERWLLGWFASLGQLLDRRSWPWLTYQFGRNFGHHIIVRTKTLKV